MNISTENYKESQCDIIKTLKIIQVGYPKSGNSLLHKLCILSLEKLGKHKTFMKSSGLSECFKKIYTLHGVNEQFYNQIEVDSVRINNGDLLLVNLFPVDDLLTLNIEPSTLLSTSNLVWSHCRPSEIHLFLLNFSIRFYIIRDGRDVINSLIHHTCRKDILKLVPKYKLESPEKVYERYDIFKKYIYEWKQNILSYKKISYLFTEIRFENLKKFGSDYEKILSIFKLEKFHDNFKDKLKFDAMKNDSPLHLRKGVTGDWKNYFSDKHKKIFKEIAGDLLIELGYEKDNNW